MPTIPLRNDFDAERVRVLAARSDDGNQARRLLSMAAIYDGMDRACAAGIGGMDRQTLRDWVHRFNAGGPAGLIDRKPNGALRRLTPSQMAALSRAIEAGPDPERDGVVRWRCIDLKQLIRTRFGVDYHERSVGKLLAALGFSHISARPRHVGQDARAQEEFKKKFSRTLGENRSGTATGHAHEVWFQDEMRVGQKNSLVRQWAPKGSRPRQVKDLRTSSAYLFGAICPERGEGAALVMPRANTEAMDLHLEEISRAVAPNAHAVVLLDQAAWHTTAKLGIPENISLVPLPPKSPELNPAENVWQYLRQNWLSNRVFDSYEAIVEASCQAWNNLTDQPWKIMSIGLRAWARTSQC